MLCTEHPKRDQNPKFTPLSERTSIPVCPYGSPFPRELKTNNLIFSVQIIGLNPVFKFEEKHIVLLSDKRHSEKLNQPSNELNLTVNRQNDLFLLVNRQKDPPPPIETLF